MSYFRLYPAALFFLGIALIVLSDMFTPNVMLSVESISSELDDLKERVVLIEALSGKESVSDKDNVSDKDSVADLGINNAIGNNFSTNKTIHAEVLEVIRAERNVHELILENERYIRNFLIAVLGVFLASIGLFGVIGTQYFVGKIAKMAEEELAGEIQCKAAAAQGTLFNHMGKFQFQQYDFGKDNSSSSSVANNLFLESAIRSGNLAVQSFNDVPKERMTKKHQDIESWAKINLAYYLAERNKKEDGSEALLLAKQVHAIAKAKSGYGWYDWEESYAFVLYRYGLEGQKQYAFQLIDELVNNPDIEDLEWKRSVKDEWDGFREKDQPS